MTPHISPPPYCLGCPRATYDDRHGKGWQWYCRQWSPTGILCTNVAVLKDCCPAVARWVERRGAV